jgi:hypothetical protein
MDAVEFINEKYRMCEWLNYECRKCKIDALEHGRAGCWGAIRKHPEEAVAIVERWAKEHPKKTRQSEFLKMFPRVKIERDVIKFCPADIDSDFQCQAKEELSFSCATCKRKFWLAEVDNDI